MSEMLTNVYGADLGSLEQWAYFRLHDLIGVKSLVDAITNGNLDIGLLRKLVQEWVTDNSCEECNEYIDGEECSCAEAEVDKVDSPNLMPYKKCNECGERKSCGAYDEDKVWWCEECGVAQEVFESGECEEDKKWGGGVDCPNECGNVMMVRKEKNNWCMDCKTWAYCPECQPECAELMFVKGYGHMCPKCFDLRETGDGWDKDKDADADADADAVAVAIAITWGDGEKTLARVKEVTDKLKATLEKKECMQCEKVCKALFCSDACRLKFKEEEEEFLNEKKKEEGCLCDEKDEFCEVHNEFCEKCQHYNVPKKDGSHSCDGESEEEEED